MMPRIGRDLDGGDIRSVLVGNDLLVMLSTSLAMISDLVASN